VKGKNEKYGILWKLRRITKKFAKENEAAHKAALEQIAKDQTD
jgi:hypothetical protein